MLKSRGGQNWVVARGQFSVDISTCIRGMGVIAVDKNPVLDEIVMTANQMPEVGSYMLYPSEELQDIVSNNLVRADGLLAKIKHAVADYFKGTDAIESQGRRDFLKLSAAYTAGAVAMFYGVRPAITEAGGDDSYKQHVSDFYNASKPVNDPNMPKGLRVHPFGEGLKAITSSSPTTFKFNGFEGEFTNDYSSNKNNTNYRNILKKAGINIAKFETFLKSHKEKLVVVYDEGLLVYFDKQERNIYTIDIGRRAAQSIKNLP